MLRASVLDALRIAASVEKRAPLRNQIRRRPACCDRRRIARPPIEEERADAFFPLASDDDGGGNRTARDCASSKAQKMRLW